jgi:phosphatidylglycerol---prolipoprotein diacylglyceryl transferase
MYSPFTTIFGRQWYTYTVLLMFGTLLMLGWLVYQASPNKRKATIDVFLAGLIGAVMLGRVIHVAVQWQYFVDRTPEIRKIYEEGGLNWHGIVIGALFGMTLMAKVRKIDMQPLLNSLALLIPILALIGWWACGTIGCAYGLPVERMADYPAGITWAQPDIFGITQPRFAIQLFGVLWSILLFMLALILHRKNWLNSARLWLILLLLSFGSFAIGFLRGDFSQMVYGLRSEQWLDIGMILFSGILFLRCITEARTNES